MCGILAIFLSTLSPGDLRKLILDRSKRQRHRGPDWNGVKIMEGKTVNHAVAHERLAIIDPISGEQPLVSEDGAITLAVNGEIYNHKDLKLGLSKPYTFRTDSDCEVIIPLYLEYGTEFVNMLRGMFSFVLYDSRTDDYIVARDHAGITPLYQGWGKDGARWFASEMKCIHTDCPKFEQFPPGHIFTSRNGELKPWFNDEWFGDGPNVDEASIKVPNKPLDLGKVREGFESAVKTRLMSDVPWGVLLSGGLDSSLVASIACRMVEEENAKKSGTFGGGFVSKIHSFTIGLKGSPDLLAAKSVADFLGTIHHGFEYTIQEGIDAIEDVIYHLETYDVTTVRASTPMFLMSRKIKSLGVKMVLSGEGADEAWGGYLYFHKAPNKREFHLETIRKLKKLQYYDCLRANKSTCSWGVEARVPFLDKYFLDQSMSLDPEHKMVKDRAEGRIEKWVLRKAFDTPDRPYLPKDILWRQKEQFSDGVGYGWIDGLKDNAAKEVTDAELANAKHIFPHNPPMTKEAYYYRKIFEKKYPGPAAAECFPNDLAATVACSTAKAIEWDEEFKRVTQNGGDASGRAVSGVHDDAYASSEQPPAKKVKTTKK